MVLSSDRGRIFSYLLVKFRFDTAENEPAKNLQNFRSERGRDELAVLDGAALRLERRALRLHRVLLRQAYGASVARAEDL